MTIPTYPDRRPLQLDDKPLLDALFARLQPQVSEFTFANLYLFRQAHAYTLSRLGEAVVVFGQGYGGEPYFLPPLSGERGEVTRQLLAAGHALYGADDRFLVEFLVDSPCPVTADRDSFDYIYLRQELAELPGNRFHKKKNRISYFTTRHDYTVELYDGRYLAGCQELLAEWQRVRSNLANRPLHL
ncbi:MAG TPA: phosphatidylglycerol lysyltransferase domain-containing protein, partial [Geobacteraceae bacterium]